MKFPSVYAVILNWNNHWDTAECVNSLVLCSYPNLTIVIVDNNSENDSEAVLRRQFPHHMFLQTGANLGFSGGNNVAIKYALDKKAEYILLLNNDTVVEPDFLHYLVEAGEKDISAGILGGKTYNYYDKARLCSAGANINWLKGTAAFHRGEGEIDKGKFDRQCYVGFIPGYFMLVKAEVFRRVGYLDERYFLGVEEIDFCVQVRQVGFKLLYVPKAHIRHKVTASHKKYAPKFIYNGYRNKLMFMNRYLSTPVWVLWYSVFRVYVAVVAPFRLRSVSKKVGEELSVAAFKNASKLAFRDRRKSKVTLEDLQQLE